MPRADDFCTVVIEDNPVPTPTNPLGVKGAGEAGTVGSLTPLGEGTEKFEMMREWNRS